MNSEELRIYTALTHPTSPEDYRITENGTKLYTMMDGSLICVEGESLDQMSPIDLYHFAQEKMMQIRIGYHR